VGAAVHTEPVLYVLPQVLGLVGVGLGEAVAALALAGHLVVYLSLYLLAELFSKALYLVFQEFDVVLLSDFLLESFDFFLTALLLHFKALLLLPLLFFLLLLLEVVLSVDLEVDFLTRDVLLLADVLGLEPNFVDDQLDLVLSLLLQMLAPQQGLLPLFVVVGRLHLHELLLLRHVNVVLVISELDLHWQ